MAPACSATAVREPLVLIGKPWNKPAARLAAPMPIISWLASTSWPVRAAKADEVEIVSVSETSVMPSAPATSSDRSARSILRHGEGREALGELAHQRHALAAEVEEATTAAMARHDRRRAPRGSWAPPGRSTRMIARPLTPMSSRGGHRLAVGHALDEAGDIADEARAQGAGPAPTQSCEADCACGRKPPSQPRFPSRPDRDRLGCRPARRNIGRRLWRAFANGGRDRTRRAPLRAACSGNQCRVAE